MGFLTAVVVIVGLVAVLNLVLTLGVVRRLREHTARLEQMSAGVADDGIILPGQRPEAFTATTVAGRAVSNETVAGPSAVAFFMPGCGPCDEWIPRFAAFADSQVDVTTIAVIVGTPDDATSMVDTLSGSAHVIVEEPRGPVATAFSVQAFPTMCRLGDDGTVVTNDNREVLAEAAAVSQ